MSKPIALLLFSAMAAAAQTAAADPSGTGTLPVTQGVYRVDGRLVAGIPYPVDVWANVWYPQGLPGGPYPLIVFLHGNHGVCRRPGTMVDLGVVNPPECPAGFEQTPNHVGYNYVMSRLASHGYIAVSVNANAINVRNNGNPERGRLVLEHLRYWRQFNSAAGAFPLGRQFSGKVDLNRVGLFGHSRGGEGVRAAYNYNRQERQPFGIRAVMELGPVDFGRIANSTAPNALFDVDNVAFSVVLPACDGDVLDNQGMRAYDRARVLPERVNRAPKSQIYIAGANHNFSNSEWTPEDPGFQCIDLPIITQREIQEDIAKVYIMGFFRTYIGGEDFHALFTGDLPPPASVKLAVHQSYTESPSEIAVIENFARGAGPGLNTAGGRNLWSHADVRSCSGATCNNPPPADWVHDVETAAGVIEWPGKEGEGTPIFGMETAPDGGVLDASGYRFLSLRVAAKFDQRNAFEGTSFSVRLVDAKGLGRLAATSSYRAIPYPSGYFFRRAVLKTIRIPLADLGGVDLTQVQRIDLVFDKAAQGAIYVTDVQFTR